LEQEAYRELEGFKNAESAFELRGKLHGLRLGMQVISSLYTGVKNVRAEANPENVKPVSRPREVGGEDLDRGPVY